MKQVFKRPWLVLLAIFLVIQFIRPAKNKSKGMQPNDISVKYNVPADVQKILKASCYDCHSNNTVYPWYAQIQPVGWWLNNHIKDGKRGLNFSEFAAYRIRKQYKRLNDINEQVKKNDMPLPSYTFIHRYAKLNDEQKLILANWTVTLQDTMEACYPADSLIKK